MAHYPFARPPRIFSAPSLSFSMHAQDKNADNREAAAEKFKEVNEAYEVGGWVGGQQVQRARPDSHVSTHIFYDEL